MPRKVLTAAAPESHQDESIQVEVTLPVRQRHGEAGAQHRQNRRPETSARIPRISRLMSLAIKFQDLVDRGDVCDYADLARLGYVTRARITQIMNLLLLAPNIQEQLIFAHGREVAVIPCERSLRLIASIADWSVQRHTCALLLLRRT